jgi:hypothetical protein
MNKNGARQPKALARNKDSGTPATVESVANYRVIRAGNLIHTLPGVSGGVRVDPTSLVSREAIQTERYGPLGETLHAAVPKDLAPGAWWWD